jgi:hypothetical protein
LSPEINMGNACKRYLAVPVLLAALGALPAVAADLAAAAVGALVKGRTWTTAKVMNYARTDTWEWRADGTLCLRLDRTDGKCDDSGTWTIDDARVCYKLDWWQKSQGLSSTCFSVSDVGNGQYEAKLPSGSTVLLFSVSPR